MIEWLRFIVATLLISTSPLVLASDVHKNETLIFAHRASSGLWIQNSRNGVQQTVALFQKNAGQFHGIEVDIVLTKDLMPVLSHDPWVHKKLCHLDNSVLVGTHLIKDISTTVLQRNYLCGANIDDEFPAAKTKEESVINFEEFLSIVRQSPELIVYLDLKIQEPLTASANQYAQSIFTLWQKFAMPNPLYIEGPDKEAIAALHHHATTNFTAVLSYPPFWANKNALLTGILATIGSYIQPKKAQQKARNANAVAVAVAAPTPVANKWMRKKLQQNGKTTIVFTPNKPKAVAKACAYGVDILITDYPTLGPCSTYGK